MNSEPLFDTLDKIHRLTDTHQWETLPVIKQMTVAEHSYMVAMCGMFTYHWLSQKFEIFQFRDKIELDILRKCLIHDVEECFIGDIVHQSKRFIKDNGGSFGNSIESAVKAIIPQNIFRELVNARLDAKSNDFPGSIVVFSDRLALILYLIKEINLGNKYMEDEWKFLYDLMTRESSEWTIQLVKDMGIWYNNYRPMATVIERI